MILSKKQHSSIHICEAQGKGRPGQVTQRMLIQIIFELKGRPTNTTASLSIFRIKLIKGQVRQVEVRGGVQGHYLYKCQTFIVWCKCLVATPRDMVRFVASVHVQEEILGATRLEVQQSKEQEDQHPQCCRHCH